MLMRKVIVSLVTVVIILMMPVIAQASESIPMSEWRILYRVLLK